MTVGKIPNLPISKKWVATGSNGDTYTIEVSVEQTTDKRKYLPEGIKSVFKIFKLNGHGEKELIVLIDNHEPFGFHEHTKLPEKEPRKEIHASNWQQAWDIFEQKIKELIS